MTLRTVLILTVCWLVSAQGQQCTINLTCGTTSCSIKNDITCSDNINIKALNAEIEVQVTGRNSARYSCNRTTCTSISSTNSKCSVETKTTTVIETKRYTTTQLVYPTITACSTTSINSQQSNSTTDTHHTQQTDLLHTTTISPYPSPTTTKCKSVAENSTLSVAIHGGYIVAILVLVAIIITLMILMGYLFKRTAPQRGPVQTTHQSLTDMTPAASTAGDYCTPVALKQLQTSIETANNSTEVYSEPVDTLSRMNSATNTQSTPSCHFTRSLSYDVNPSYDGVALCDVNPSYRCNSASASMANNGYAVIQPPSHPPLPDPPTADDDDSNAEYTKPVQMDTLPPLAENDYEVVKDIKKPQRD